MHHRLVRLAALVIAIGALTVGLAVAATGGSIVPGDDRETAITGAALEQASAAALAHTGGGRVTETEAGDEDGYYEVEVMLEDGSSVDVHLDRSFSVLGSKVDGEDEGQTPAD